jgi:nicotinamidase/pyrazinamidase
MMPRFKLVIATQDWHPAKHGSFAAQHTGMKPGDQIMLNGLRQILWPIHCVQNTRGAEFAPGLNLKGIHHTVRKGTDPAIDSYSGFFDNGQKKETGLHDLLQRLGADDLSIMGLATDYCVKFTALGARMLGYPVSLIADGCRGVDLRPGDSQRAEQEMIQAGVTIIDSQNIR